MKFAYPEFLYALFAIAIPIIIHLFNFRKFKKIYFSNVEFLKEVQQETQAKSKLKHLLILLSRILAITFLVLAFAQPYLPASDQANTSQHSVVGLYIDNSFSMESIGENGSLLHAAKVKAAEVVSNYRSTDKFILVTNDFRAGDQRLLGAEEVTDKIENIEISSESRKLSAIYSRMNDALNSSEINDKSLYLFSDFQRSTADFKSIKADSAINTYLVPEQSGDISNIYIDSCWFATPTHLINQNEELSVRIKNNSNNDLENIPLKLFINGQSVVPATFSVKANDETILVLNYMNRSYGHQQGRIELQDNTVTMDDAFFFAYEIAQNIEVLSIGNTDDERALRSVFSTDSMFHYRNFQVNQLDYSLIKKSDFVIVYHLDDISSGLASALQAFVENGGNLYIIPSDQIDLNSYKEFLSLLSINYFTGLDTADTKVRDINYKHPVYNNVFESEPEGNINLPVVTNHYQLSKSTVGFRTALMNLKNGDSFLTAYQVGKGTVYLNSSSLTKESSNYTNHAIFVPTLYNMSLLSRKQFPLFHTIGSQSTIDLDRSEKDDVYHIKNDQVDIIPQIKNTSNYTTVFVNNGIETAGNYLLENGKEELALAFNYDRLESDLHTLNPDEIESVIASGSLNARYLNTSESSMQSALSELNIGKKYWKYCIILALLFLAVEIALIKLLKS
ncbi:MAG: BatA domain-containing protein [Flavobacteriales bacterium]|nr:BatA domain-containing protein [Flavobacteriales bacterium]